MIFAMYTNSATNPIASLYDRVRTKFQISNSQVCALRTLPAYFHQTITYENWVNMQILATPRRSRISKHCLILHEYFLPTFF